MEPLDVIREIQRTGTVEQPWSVLVQERTVKEVLRPEEADTTAAAAQRLTLETDKPVIIYAVDSRLPHPPPVGSPVDPLAMGWVESDVRSV